MSMYRQPMIIVIMHHEVLRCDTELNNNNWQLGNRQLASSCCDGGCRVEVEVREMSSDARDPRPEFRVPSSEFPEIRV